MWRRWSASMTATRGPVLSWLKTAGFGCNKKLRDSPQGDRKAHTGFAPPYTPFQKGPPMSDVKDDSDDPEDDSEPSSMVFPDHYDRAEDYFRDKLLVDVTRVKKLLDLNAPRQILASSLCSVVRTAIGL